MWNLQSHQSPTEWKETNIRGDNWLNQNINVNQDHFIFIFALSLKPVWNRYNTLPFLFFLLPTVILSTRPFNCCSVPSLIVLCDLHIHWCRSQNCHNINISAIVHIVSLLCLVIRYPSYALAKLTIINEMLHHIRPLVNDIIIIVSLAGYSIRSIGNKAKLWE